MRVSLDPPDIIQAGEVDYQQAWDMQRSLVEQRLAGGPDSVLLLTHPATYTAGRRTQAADRPTDGASVIEVDRGGRITWHGPGQLVGYPIVKLADPIDVVAYVRMLEQVLIASCADLGLPAVGRIAGRSGVWLAADRPSGRVDRKVAAIGVRIARSVTLHGFALNCDADLSAFDRIVPCGLADAGVSSLTTELGRRVSVDEALPVVESRLRQALDGRLPLTSADVVRSAPGVRVLVHT